MVINVRARKDEHKLERRQAILAAAAELWDETTYAEFTMAAVAERAGIVKGTVYLYFETKEQLFLAMIGDLLTAYFDDVDAALEEGGRWSKSRVVAALVDALEGRDAFTRMITTLGSICEHNVSFEFLLVFKRLMHERFARTAALITRRLPFLDAESAARFITHVSALVTGFAQITYPSPVMDRIYELPDMAVTKLDLITEVRAAAKAMLDGMEANA